MTDQADPGKGSSNVTRPFQASSEDRVYARLRSAIVKRYIGPGKQLVEESLARQLGVSRTPVRAAIRRLVYDGFVEVVPHRGAFVIRPTRREIEDAFAVRIGLERMAARLAAGFVSPEDLACLDELIEEEAVTFGYRNVEAYYRVNDAFHLKLAEASGNRTLRKFVADVLARVNIYLILFDPFMRLEVNPSPEQHRDIVNALRRRDPAGAEEAVRRHLENTLAGLELDKVAEQYPDDYLAV